MPTILHICSAFFNTNLYVNLVRSLDKLGVNQIIYVPLKYGENYDKLQEIEKQFKAFENTTLVYSVILKKSMRVLYHLKIKTILNDIESKIDLSMIDIVHSHFLYSNGGVAFEIKKKYNIPYISAIRNTDVNIFYKYFINLRLYAKEMLKASESIIFISPSYQNFLKKSTFRGYENEFTKKTKVIPNGIDTFWLNTTVKPRDLNKGEIRFLFIGVLDSNKNIEGAISFLKNIEKTYKLKIKFTIIGPETKKSSNILKLIKTNNWIDYLGPVYEKETLKKEFNKSDFFIMLSKKETFGLVYIEAMSQGLPIIYTKNQGVDGYFKEGHVGVPINILDLKLETSKIRALLNNYSKISNTAIVESKTFNWEAIANKYCKIYKGILNIQ